MKFSDSVKCKKPQTPHHIATYTSFQLNYFNETFLKRHKLLYDTDMRKNLIILCKIPCSKGCMGPGFEFLDLSVYLEYL